MDETNGGYKVGRGKPPSHTRFKKGQSGNPCGPRPNHLPALLLQALNEPVVVTATERPGGSPKGRWFIAQLVDRWAGADLRATKMLIDLLKDIEKRASPAPRPEPSPATPADEEVIKNLIARLRRTELAKTQHGDTEDME